MRLPLLATLLGSILAVGCGPADRISPVDEVDDLGDDDGDDDRGPGDGPDCTAATSEKLYVVTSDYKLLAFDPTALPASGSADAAFASIGQLNCPAQGGATPFSMSIDREGRAWVLYSSGEIFFVSIEDASCAASGFAPSQAGFDVFGMGFVSDAEGSDAETLYIAGGDALQLGGVQFGSIDKDTMTVTPIGPMTVGATGPELTGTGKAELWGYYPGDESEDAHVGKLDKASGDIMMDVPMGAAGGQPSAWAFGQFGGKFYVFISYLDLDTFFETQAVQVVDPMTSEVVDFETSYTIVGAGVSTCAPADPVG
jgi:hypothetical protein